MSENLSQSSQEKAIDGNEHELDEKSNHAHNGKANGGLHENLLVLLGLWLAALLHQTIRVLGESLHGLGHVLIHKLPVKAASGEKRKKREKKKKKDAKKTHAARFKASLTGPRPSTSFSQAPRPKASLS